MGIFKCTPEKLAKLLAGNSEMYNVGVSFLKFVKGRNILSPDLEGKLEIDIKLLRNAQNLATRGKWFAFYVYDSWAEEHYENSEGIELYQKIDAELIRRLGVDSDGVPREEGAIKMLKANRIKRIFTLTPDSSEGYCGVEYESLDDGDGEVIQRKALEEYQIPYFKNAEIDVVRLEN
ncbi:MAG: hypothetical protein AABX07_04185 [Nanoarchaeota archaeon]